MDPSWQPRTGAAQRRRGRRLRAPWRHEQQSIAQALATFTHHSAREQKTGRAGEGVRGEVHGQIPGAPPPQAAGTQYFAMDVDEVPAAGGSRPDRLAPVSGPQERVQRHFVQQLVEPVRGVPVLDAPVPQLVEKLEDVLKIFDFLVPVQEIEVPKISSPSRPPPPRVVPVPQPAEQLVDVPLPEWMRLALGSDAAGRVWTCVWKQSTGVYWCLEGTQHTQLARLEGFTASPGRYKGVRPVGASDPVHLQSVGHSCCVAETSTHSAQLCRRPEIRQVQFLGGCRRARCCATTVLWFRQCRTNVGAAAAVHRRGVDPL